MNKFTLKFLDDSNEEQYKTINYQFKFEILMAFNIIVVATGIPQMYQAVAINDQNKFLIQLALCIFSLLNTPICWYHKNWCEHALLIINHSITLIQLTPTNQSEQFMYGACVMMGHSVIIMACDFWTATFQIINISVIRLILWSKVYEELEPSLFIVTFTLLIVYIFCLYKLNYSRKQLYLLTLKDDQYKQVLKNIINEPFLLFHYNPVNLQFVFDSSSTHINNQECLREFLRTSEIDKVPLELYFFNRIQMTVNKSKISVKNHKKVYQIEYSQLNSIQQTILLVFQKETRNIDYMVHFNQIQRIQKMFYTYLQSQYVQLNRALVRQSIIIVSRQRLLNLIVMLKLKIVRNEPKIEILNLFKIFKKLKELFYDKQIQIDFNFQQLTLNSVKPYLYLLLIHFIRSFKSKKVQIFYCYNSDKDVVIQFKGKSYFPNHSLFKKVQISLVKQITMINDPIYSGVCVTLYQDPFIKFD